MVIGRRVLVLTTFTSILIAPRSAAGQASIESGLVATGLLLRQMDGVKRVLMVGAHPDDEDTSLLATLSRRYGAETAYLALTRGEGGQNLIGPELWDGLGIIRTGELEAARRLDGGRQFFTRAFDFGYSKRADEALTLWPRDELLHDVVWIIRRYRPQVVVAVFSGTPRDGHGQHQASGIMAREAFEAAGDPSRFPEQLREGVEAWAPAKLLELTWRRPETTTVAVPTGDYDPLLGRSELQLAMESRSFHRSQDFGASQPMGPRDSGVRVERSRVGRLDDPGIFSGIDTTLVGAASDLRGSAAAGTRAALEAYRAALARARSTFGGSDPFAVASDLRDALGHLLRAREAAAAAGTELRHVLDRKIDLAQRAVLAASGIVLDVRADDDMVTPGQRVRVTAQVWNGGPSSLPVAEARLSAPDGWSIERVSLEGLRPDGALDSQSLATWTFDVTVPGDAPRTEMYYLRRPREGSWYSWPEDPDLWGLPRDPAPVSGVFDLGLGDVDLYTAREWAYVGVNPARGEYRRPVLVVPALSVALSPGALVWPTNRNGTRTLSAAVRTEASGGARGRVSLEAPEGWVVAPEAYDVELDGAGAERSFAFEIRPPAVPEEGSHTFSASVRDEHGRVFTDGFSIIDYEHIARAALYRPARSEVSVVPVRVAEGLRVGYVMGTGDAGPEVVRQLGGEVTLLDVDQVLAGAFSDFDVLVLGVRAYEARPDVRAANAQILDFARTGGTVVVQYNQYDWARGSYAPYPIAIGRPADRVAEEDATVTVLEPDAPLFTTPNRITAADFEGWVQERGLYYLSDWDERYTPLLSMHDQGEAPKLGSVLVAPVGEGLYVYAALSFFRQWASGSPGPYRLFANLISLRAPEWRRHRAGAGN